MKRFGLVLDDNLYTRFTQVFISYGQKTSVLRRCVELLVQKAEEQGGILDRDIDSIIEKIKKERGDGNVVS